MNINSFNRSLAPTTVESKLPLVVDPGSSQLDTVPVSRLGYVKNACNID